MILKQDKNIYYQRGTRKGTMKVAKEWSGCYASTYILSTDIRAYDTVKDFWVK